MFNKDEQNKETEWNSLNFKQKTIKIIPLIVIGCVTGIAWNLINGIKYDTSNAIQNYLSFLFPEKSFPNFPLFFLISICIGVYSKTNLRAFCNTAIYLFSTYVTFHIGTLFVPNENFNTIWYIYAIVFSLFAMLCWNSCGIGLWNTILRSCLAIALAISCIENINILNIPIFIGASVCLQGNTRYQKWMFALYIGLTLLVCITQLIYICKGLMGG